MEGQPHLLDNEILEYECSLSNINNSDISNDEDDDSADEVNNPTGFLRQPINGRTRGISRPPALRTSTPTSNGMLKHRQNGIELSEDDDD